MLTLHEFKPPPVSGDADIVAKAVADYLRRVNANGGLAIIERNTYTPTITAATGTFTTVAATGVYWVIQNQCFYEVIVTITTVGTAAGACIFTLPFVNVARDVMGYGRETVLNGKQLTVTIPASSTTGEIRNYDNSTPNASTARLVVAGNYQIP